jgi:tetratricopeptide (TPR) repeat protein
MFSNRCSKFTRVGWAVLALSLMGIWFGCAEEKAQIKPQTVAPSIVRDKSPEETYNEAMERMTAQDPEKAMALLKQTLAKAKDPAKFIEAHYNLGVLLLRKGDLEGAKKEFEQVVTQNPKHRDALVDLGVVLKSQHKYPEAIEVFRKGLKEVPRDPLLMNNLIVAYRLNKQYKEAENTSHRLLARAPTNVEAYKNMTLVYYDQGKWEMAELSCINAGKMLEQQRKKDPSLKDDPGIYNNLGMIYVRTGKYREALAEFNKALTVDPGYLDALINVGAIAHRFRDYPRAISAYEKVLTKDAHNEKALRGLAYASYGAGNTDKAIELLTKVIERKPDDAKSVYVLGVIHDTYLQAYAKAVTYYERYKSMKGNTIQPSDPVFTRLEAVKARMQMDAQAKAEEAKQKKEEEEKRKVSEKQTAGSRAQGEEKLKEILKGTSDEGAQPPANQNPDDKKPQEQKPVEPGKNSDPAKDQPKDQKAKDSIQGEGNKNTESAGKEPTGNKEKDSGEEKKP